MTVDEDPEGTELKVIEKYAAFKDKDVLEVGCGEGRLTFQYAASARSVYAIDASSRAIAKARKTAPKKLASKIGFHVGRGSEIALSGRVSRPSFLLMVSLLHRHSSDGEVD